MLISFLKKLGIRTHVAILCLSLIVPALVLILVTGLRQIEQSTQDTEEWSLRLAKAFSIEQGHILAQTENFLRTLALDPAMRAPGPECDRQLAELMRHTPQYSTLLAINSNGDVYGSGTKLSSRLNVSGRPWFQEGLRTGKPVIGQYVISKSTGRASLPVAYPFQDEAGRVKGFLVAAVDLHYYGDLLASLHQPLGAVLTIVDRDGTIIFRDPNRSRYLGQPIPPRHLAVIRATRTDGHFTGETLENDQHYFSFTNLRDSDGNLIASVIIGLPEKTISSRTARTLKIQIGGVVILAVLALLTIQVLGRRLIVEPVTRLGQAAARLAEGRDPSDLDLNQLPGDMHGLGQAFTRMSARLLEREKRLLELQNSLNSKLTFISILMDTVPIPLYYKDKNGVYRDCNAACARALGLPRHEILGRSSRDVTSPETAALIEASDAELLATGQPQVLTFQAKTNTGLVRDVRINRNVVRGLDGQIEGSVSTVTDLTAEVRTQAELRESLREKDILLKEVHHRVKNNLQIVSSLLHLQSGNLKDPEALDIFRDCRERIQAMALIHEELYQSKSFATISFASYLDKLIRRLSAAFPEAKGVRIRLRAEEVSLPIDMAVPLGLLVNELVTNAYKHAFTGQDQGEVSISLGQDGNRIVLDVEDNGQGLPDGFAMDACTTLGMQIVRGIACQLGADISCSSVNGATFTVSISRSAEGDCPA